MSKARIIKKIIDVEGGYVNDPSDSGGETMYGITLAVARDNGYTGPMRELTYAQARDIYETRYWDVVLGDDLLAISEMITVEVVDTCVNMGPGTAIKLLQRALNAFNMRGYLYPDVAVDGHIGAATLSALAQFVELRDTEILARALNCLQGAKYIALGERREKDEKYMYGWFKNRVRI